MKKGDKIEILFDINGERKWLPGKFISKVSALDREYRVCCITDSGLEIREAAAPECVRSMKNMNSSLK
jgi:hypothetical protein